MIRNPEKFRSQYEAGKEERAEEVEIPKEGGAEEKELPWYVEEKASRDLGNLRALEWFGPEQKESLFANKDYKEARDTLKQLNYDRLLPIAKSSRESFQKQHQNEALTKEETEKTINYACTELDRLLKEKGIKGEKVSKGTVAGRAGEGFKNPEDLARIYFAPKLQKEDLSIFLGSVTEKINDLNCEFKLYTADWYKKVKESSGKFRTSKDLNRFVVYLDRENSKDITSLLNRLAKDEELLSHLEDSGEWADSYRLPLASGISLVEGSRRSWDMGVGQIVRKLKKIFRGIEDDEIKLWRGSSQYKDSSIQEAIQTKSLTPLGRSTKMPALKL